MAISSNKEAENNGQKVICPECGVAVNESRLARHIQKVHRDQEIQEIKKINKPISSGKAYIDDGGFIVNPGRWNWNNRDHSNRIVGHATSFPEGDIHSHVFEDIKNAPDEYSKDRTEHRKAGKVSQYLRVDKPNRGQRPMTRDEIVKKVTSFELPCTICGDPVSPGEWMEHMNKEHPKKVVNEERNKYLSRLVRCGGCSKIFKFGDIVTHLMDRHNHPGVGDLGWKIKNPRMGSHTGGRSDQPKGILHHPETNTDKSEKRRKELIDRYFSVTNLKAQQESDDEPRDGSKYLGFISREQGKFGSYPLHDNYDDESDAE